MFRGKVYPEAKEALTLRGVYKISTGCMINIPESDFADCIPDSHFSKESEYSEDDETINDNNADIQDGDEWYGCVSTIRHGGKDDFSKTLKSNTIKLKTDADGNTLLHIAVYEDKEDMLDILLKRYPKQINKENKKKQTPLHIAAKFNRSEIARKLIEKEAERDIQDRNMFTPLLTAVRYDSLEVFDLLVDESTNGGTKNIDMQLLQIAAEHNSKRVAEKLIQTHDAAFLASDKNEKNLVYLATDKNSVDVLEMLLKKNHTSAFVNSERLEPETVSKLFHRTSLHRNTSSTVPYIIRKDGENDIKKQINTPLHIAAREGYLGCLKVLISVPEVNLFRKSEHGETALHLAAANGNKRVVEELLKAAPELKHMKDESKQTALYSAIKHVKIVEILINSGANVNIQDNHGRTPISYAAETGQLECTNKLIENKANINLEDKEKMKPIHYAAEKGQSEVFRVLLEKSDLAEFEKSFWNCLDLAINENQVEIANIIFQVEDTEKWKIMMQSRSKIDESVDTPMRKLIRKMPDVAKVVFDKCVQIESTTDQNFNVNFNYEFLDDADYLGRWKETTRKTKENVPNDLQEQTDKDINQKTSEDTPYTKDGNVFKTNHPLMIMVKSKHTQLLDHPLVSALLRRKWNRFGLFLSAANFLLYAVFLILLTGFATDVRPPYEFNNSPSYKDVECSEFENDRIPEFARIAQPGIIIVAGVVILIEILEMKQMFSWKVWLYFMEIENCLELVTCTTAIIFVVDINGCDIEFGYKPQFQWICGTISVFFAWTNMLCIIQKFEWFGIHVVLLKRILKMFLKFFFVFLCLIIAFALSFFFLFQNQQHFSTFGISFMKTTSMMIGGPDFVTTFLDETVHYELISYFFFYGFMLLMTIVLINLLVGLAVSNIHEFQEKAGHTKKQMQVKFILELERIAIFRFRFLNKCSCLKILLSKIRGKQVKIERFCPKEQGYLRRKYEKSWKLSERHITAAMKTEKDDTSIAVARLDTKMKALETKLETRMKHVDDQLETILETRMKHVDNQLAAILDKIGRKAEEN